GPIIHSLCIVPPAFQCFAVHPKSDYVIFPCKIIKSFGYIARKNLTWINGGFFLFNHQGYFTFSRHIYLNQNVLYPGITHFFELVHIVGLRNTILDSEYRIYPKMLAEFSKRNSD